MKRFLLFLILVTILPMAFAEVKLLEPVVREVQSGSTFLLGSIQPGETIEIAISKEYSGGTWGSLSVDESTLPIFWTYAVKEFDKTFSVSLLVHKGYDLRTQNIKIIAKNQIVESPINIQLTVNNALLKCGMSSLNETISLGQTTTFKLTCVNDSIAEHNFSIKSTLPIHWFKSQAETIKANSSAEYPLAVAPYGYGKFDFKFQINSELNDNSQAFNMGLTVNPTLKGKYMAAVTGLPLTVPSLIVFYIINSFLAYIS